MIGAKAKELIGESMRRNEGDRERNKGAYKSQRESHQRRRPSKRIKKTEKRERGWRECRFMNKISFKLFFRSAKRRGR